ncbi:MAG: thiamine-phosphate pyrophosphorylase [Chlamydiales bacterium]
MKEVKGLYVIVNSTTDDEYSPIELAKMAIRGGADVIQFRDKEKGSDAFLFFSKGIRDLCQEAGVTFIVNDRVDIAEAVDADGVHLGQGDFPISVARSVLGEDKIIGGTAGNLEEARRVEESGANYIGFGHIFPTQSKEKEGAPLGLEALEELCCTTDLPVIAIGGISEENVCSVIESGATGVAVISAVCDSEDPQEDTQRLKKLIESFSRSGAYVSDK